MQNDISYEFLIDCIHLSVDKKSLLGKLGFGYGGSAYRKLNVLCSSFGININDYFIQRGATKYSNDEIFSENSIWCSSFASTKIKKRIIKSNLIEYKCSVCGNDGIWMGKDLMLQIHHKNGINNDNKLENLEFLCPNCHTQTETFAGKNKKGL